jgi:hypothetical protein
MLAVIALMAARASDFTEGEPFAAKMLFWRVRCALNAAIERIGLRGGRHFRRFRDGGRLRAVFDLLDFFMVVAPFGLR